MRLALPCRKLFISLLPLALCCTAAADDTALRVSSGAVQAMDDHPTVRMESCRIEGDITREQTQVRCEFVFVNDGPATTVTMGFPAFRGYGDGVSPKAIPALTGFRSWVDDKVVSTRIIERSRKPDQRPDRWYVKAVRFASGQRRVVRDEYLQPNGEISSGMRFFPYTLETGASWHGPIGQVEFVLRWTEPYEWKLYSARHGPSAWHVSEDGRTVSWTSKDLEPEHNISFYFIPWSGYLYCDGLALGAFRLSGTDVWTQVRSLAMILRATVAYDHRSKTASITTRADGEIHVTAGKPTARVDGQAFALAGAPYIEDGTWLWLPADAILEHLGHSFEINREEHRFDVSTGAPVVWEAECQSTMVGDDRHTRRPIRLTRVDDVLVGEIRPVMRLLPEAGDILLEPDQAGSRPGIRIRLNSRDLSFWWYTARARLDGKPYALPVAPYLTLEGKGMGPLEAICAALDLQCTYDEEEKLLTISTAEGG
jgi:hypothetical protein